MLRINNRDARRLWLSVNGLAGPPTGAFDVMEIIKNLGFVQIDTIRNVTRAHHHILWSRNQNYREKMLWSLLGKDRLLFEHFTHDASLIPMEFLPMWRRQFQTMGDYVARNPWYHSDLGKSALEEIKAQIVAQGALSTHAFDTKIEGERKMWARPPHKKALDQMWYAGELATCYRKNFVKYYNLAERVFPEHLHRNQQPASVQIDWLCTAALHRLGVANHGEVSRFWGAVKLAEVRAWAVDARQVEIEAHDGAISTALATPDILQRLEKIEKPTSRLRIINPFDPAIRDRKRLERLFGFEYRNEMFVPKVQRKWGYYVYPLLESGRFVGRIELKADRKNDWLRVTGFWPEMNVKWTDARQAKLDAELARFARFVGISSVEWMV